MVVQNNKNEIQCISKGGPIQTWIKSSHDQTTLQLHKLLVEYKCSF